MVSGSPDLAQGGFHPPQSSVWFPGTGGIPEGYQPCCSLRSHPLPSISPERAKPLWHIHAVKTSGLLTQLFFPARGKGSQLALHKKRWEAGGSWWGAWHGSSDEVSADWRVLSAMRCPAAPSWVALRGEEMICLCPSHPCSGSEGWCMRVSSGCGYHTLKKTFQPKDCEEPQVFSEKEKKMQVSL